MAKKFDGELSWINPEFLITENKNYKIESFFLGLAVIFNDLRGLLLLEKLLIETYEKPASGEVISHAGHYSGTLVQIQKLIASTIHEFFEFLKENSEVLNESEFKEVLSRLPKSERGLWNAIVVASDGKLLSVIGLLKSVVKIRSNIAFHYDHSGKILKRGYNSRFFGGAKDARSGHAFYTIDEENKNTRFYFADAAVEESLYIAAGKKPKEDSAGNLSLEKYQRQIRETVEVMSITIASLLKNYLKLRRNRPH